jgi:prolyl 4-hydroxylase
MMTACSTCSTCSSNRRCRGGTNAFGKYTTAALFSWFVLLTVSTVVVPWTAPSSIVVVTTALTTLNGGFGARNRKSNSKGKIDKRNGFDQKENNKKKKNLLLVAPKENEALLPPKLDKWGLPVATLDDIFPPLPPDTELIPANSSRDYSLSEIQNSLKDHIDLNLSRFFHDDAYAKIPNDDGTVMKIRLLHQSPPVLVIDHFMTTAECQELQQLSTSARAYQVDSATFQGSISTRTSTSWFCHYSDVPILLAKAHYLLNIPLEIMEEPQLVRYQHGQEFSWHYDEVPTSQLDNGGQRVATLLVYLTSVQQAMGGGTTFRDLRRRPATQQHNKSTTIASTEELVMQPSEGTALLFFPAFADGQVDDRTLHKSQIMESKEPKWIVQMWVHQHAYRAALPPRNSIELAIQILEETREKLGYLEITNNVTTG